MESCLRDKPVHQLFPGNRRHQGGNTILEFAIIAPFFIMTFFGTVGLGLMFGRYIQAVHVCRDIAHMYSDGVDFTQSQSQNIVVQLAAGTGMTATGGNGAVILSRIVTVYQADCDAAGYSGSCNNLNQQVITQRIRFGDTTLRSSAFGTPTQTLINAQGNIALSVYLQNTDSSVRATGFGSLLAVAGAVQGDGDAAYVAEVFFAYPDLYYLGLSALGGAYARFIF